MQRISGLIRVCFPSLMWGLPAVVWCPPSPLTTCGISAGRHMEAALALSAQPTDSPQTPSEILYTNTFPPKFFETRETRSVRKEQIWVWGERWDREKRELRKPQPEIITQVWSDCPFKMTSATLIWHSQGSWALNYTESYKRNTDLTLRWVLYKCFEGFSLYINAFRTFWRKMYIKDTIQRFIHICLML